MILQCRRENGILSRRETRNGAAALATAKDPGFSRTPRSAGSRLSSAA